MSRSRLITAILLVVAVGILSACDKVPLLAPTSSTITLTVSTTVVPVNGTAEVTASVTESAGTPVQNGTVVTFTSSFGTVDPVEARTQGGKASVRFLASQQSGTAQIGAFSGASRAEVLEIKVGGAAAARLVVRADPQTVPASGGSTQIVATVLDEFGNRLPGVPVTFSTNAGQLSPGSAVTDATGEARATLTTPRTATVTASAGGQDATIEVTASSPGVTITPPTTAIEAGVAAIFTIAPLTGTTGNVLREVVMDFGDNTPQVRLGSVQGPTTVAHTYSRPGTYTVTATAIDTQGIEGPSSIVVNVTDQSSVSVTLTATPNPVTLGATQQGLVTFTASTGGLGGGTVPITSFTWEFGDGGSAFTTGPSTNHRYSAAGTYVATVTVRTTTGVSGVGQFTIRVNPG